MRISESIYQSPEDKYRACRNALAEFSDDQLANLALAIRSAQASRKKVVDLDEYRKPQAAELEVESKPVPPAGWPHGPISGGGWIEHRMKATGKYLNGPYAYMVYSQGGKKHVQYLGKVPASGG